MDLRQCLTICAYWQGGPVTLVDDITGERC